MMDARNWHPFTIDWDDDRSVMKEVCNLVGIEHITASGVHYYLLPAPFSLSTQVFPPSLPIFAPDSETGVLQSLCLLY